MARPSQSRFRTARRSRPAATSAPSTVVETACPLDCPDACSLAVTVQHGRIVEIDGSKQEPGHRRIHLREGAEVRRARVRPRPPALSRPSGRAARAKASSARHVGRSARARRRAVRRRRSARRRRIDPALLVRRIERPADAGQPRRAAVAAVRHVAARAHGVRRADRRGQPGALRQDAVGHLPGLPARAADRAVGREPVGIRHPSRAVRARGAEARRAGSS